VGRTHSLRSCCIVFKFLQLLYSVGNAELQSITAFVFTFAVSVSGTLYPHKLAITSPTSGGRSVGMVRSWTQTMEFSFLA
jgi:hypothetical protein